MKTKISVKPFEPKAFAKLLMQPNVKIVGCGGLNFDDLKKASKTKFKEKNNEK